MNRRDMITGVAALALGPLAAACREQSRQEVPKETGSIGSKTPAASSPQHADVPALQKVASAKGCTFGSAVQSKILQAAIAVDTIVAECSSLTPEWEMKWDSLAPVAGRYDFGAADKIAQFARLNGMTLRGHTLLWHKSLPKWATARIATTRDWRHVGDHIGKLARRFGSVVAEWDVVNEPIEIGPRADGLRPTPFLEAYGPDYIDRAFWTLHEVAPKAGKSINEYGFEYENADEKARRRAFLRLLEGMVGRGVPVTAVGLQAHLDLRKGNIDKNGLSAMLRDISEMGLDIAVTELDVRERDFRLALDRRDMLVADEVRRYLDIVLDFPAVRSVTTWGLSDRNSWLAYQPDGSPLNRGLPYDAQWRAKPMRNAIATAFA